MRLSHPFLLILLFAVSSINGQENIPANPNFCGEHLVRERLAQENADYHLQDSVDHVHAQTHYENFLEGWSPDDRSTYVIPVVVHVVHINGTENISNEQIFNAIETLNNDFNMLNSDLSNTIPAFQGITGNGNIEFRLATKDPTGIVIVASQEHYQVQLMIPECLGISSYCRCRCGRTWYLASKQIHVDFCLP